jgi:uncharacterized damage-inducible protein DinB
MTISMADHYRRLFEYEKDSHAKVLASLQAVPADLKRSPSFQQAVDLMAHIIAARMMWLFRFGIRSDGPKDLSPRDVSPEDISMRLNEMQSAWTDYLATLNDVDVQSSFEYQSLDAGRFRSTIQDILTQLFGHSLYHRGQIAALIRSIGAEPATTDFVFWTREPL